MNPFKNYIHNRSFENVLLKFLFIKTTFHTQLRIALSCVFAEHIVLNLVFSPIKAHHFDIIIT